MVTRQSLHCQGRGSLGLFQGDGVARHPGPAATLAGTVKRSGGAVPAEPRPRVRLSREVRRHQILRSAAAVFGRLGFENARMEDVAKEAGIAKGLLYKHFPSKDELFRALVAQQGRTYASELRSALAEQPLADDPAAALRAGLAFWLGLLGDERASFNLTDPGVHSAYDGLRASLRQVIADALRTVAPSTPEPYPQLVAALVQGSAENLGLAWRDLPERVDQREALELLTEFCWGGLAALAEAGRYLKPGGAPDDGPVGPPEPL